MPDGITEAREAEMIASRTELHRRDADRFAACLKYLGYDPDKVRPWQLTKAKLRKFVEDLLNAGMTYADIAETMNIPPASVPYMVRSILPPGKFRQLRDNNAELFSVMGTAMAPQALHRLGRMLTHGEDKDAVKAAELIAKLARVLGPDVMVQNQTNILAQDPEILERYRGRNLEKLLGREVAPHRRALPAAGELDGQEGGESDDGGAGGDGGGEA